MYSVRTLFADAPATSLLDKRNGNGNKPDPTDVWLFTDPAARALYAMEGKLARLEQDIRTYVMFNGRWRTDELDFKREINRLTYSNALVPQSAFGHLSPHPTIYRAIKEGQILIAGEYFHFGIGDDVVFEPWVARLSHPGLAGPLRIGRLNTITRRYLCREEFPQMRELCERDLEILHKILYSPTRRKGLAAAAI